REWADRDAEAEIAITTRLRRPGGGRIRKTEEHPELIEALDKLVDPVTRGDPESPLCWTCKSTAALARELTTRKRKVSENTVRRLLKSAGYSLQGNCKTREGSSHPDRNAQFEHINVMVRAIQDRCQPAISVDTKKKEMVGD